MLCSICFLLFIVFVNGDTPETVKELDLTKYTGRWYQVYSNLYVLQTQEPNSMCITVDYSLLNNTTMLATTHCRLYSPKGSEMRIKAQVVCPNKDVPGNLQRLVEGAPYPTPYMVILLGPVNKKTNQYEYAVVTDANKVALYIYARDLHVFRKNYQDHVIKFCRDNDFSSYYNEPREIPQPHACLYTELNGEAMRDGKHDETFHSDDDEREINVVMT